MNYLQKETNDAWIKHSVLSASSTPRLVEEMKKTLADMGFHSYGIYVTVDQGRPIVHLSTSSQWDCDYDDVLMMDNVVVTVEDIRARVKLQHAYIKAELQYIADIPKNIQALLVATGNIKSSVVVDKSISCTI